MCRASDPEPQPRNYSDGLSFALAHAAWEDRRLDPRERRTLSPGLRGTCEQRRAAAYGIDPEAKDTRALFDGRGEAERR